VYDPPVERHEHSSVEIKVLRLSHGEGIELPAFATAGAAGADVRSAEPGPVTVAPGQRVAIATGLVFEIRQGWEIQVRPRSGLALKHGLTVVNAPGTIDSDYRGEVRILMVNLGERPVVVERGDRIAQLIVAPVHRAVFTEVDRLSETRRAEGGFGSTGRT